MILRKLYPPHIEGTIPAFYKTYDNLTQICSGAVISIPFSMNQSVGYDEIAGFMIRIKSVSSGECILTQPTINYDPIKQIAYFYLSASMANKFNDGQFYKVQLAYFMTETSVVILGNNTIVNANEINEIITPVVGYYSTVGVIKCVSYPKVEIKNYDINALNLFTDYLTGVYDTTNSLDQTEKVYSYSFDFYTVNGDIAYSTGQLIHNTNNDIATNYSTDILNLPNFMEEGKIYNAVYTVTTLNGLVVSSPIYKVSSITFLTPTKTLSVIPEANPEEGYISIHFGGEDANSTAVGTFVLSRSCERENFSVWSELQRFTFGTIAPRDYILQDFSVEQGVGYRYGIQQYNMWGLLSSRSVSDEISVDFEDMFLYDGEHQLKIRFNPKMYSFKTTVLDQKVETIGSKYPFAFRNGAVSYKEFPIEGLISFQMDNADLFTRKNFQAIHLRHQSLSDAELNNAKIKQLSDPEISYFLNHLNTNVYGLTHNQIIQIQTTQAIPIGTYYWDENQTRYIEIKDRKTNYISTELIEKNVLHERDFKLAVLDWLNNGQAKFFRSATEGNYIIRLKDVSLTPENALGRMLHSFRATAFEIADCSYANLIKFNFLQKKDFKAYNFSWKTFNLSDYANLVHKTFEFEQEILSFKIDNMIPGSTLYLYFDEDPQPTTIVIGPTGSYYFENSEKLLRKVDFFPRGYLTGTFEVQYISLQHTSFDDITNIEIKGLISRQFIGINPDLQALSQTKVIDNPSSNDNSKNFSFSKIEQILRNTKYRIYFYDTFDQVIAAENSKELGEPILMHRNMKNILNDIGIYNSLKENTFNPNDILMFLESYIYNKNGETIYKTNLLDVEHLVLRRRPIVQVYKLPEAYADNLGYDTTEYEKDCSKWVYAKNQFFNGPPVLCNDNTIEGKIINLQDSYCIYEIYENQNNKWELQGSSGQNFGYKNYDRYYDAYWDVFFHDYETWFSLAPGEKMEIGQKDYICFEKLGKLEGIYISNGLIAEVTGQSQFTDYYTEQINDYVIEAKKDYDNALDIIFNMQSVLNQVEKNDNIALYNETLFKVYHQLLYGSEESNLVITTQMAGKHWLMLAAILKYDTLQPNIISRILPEANITEAQSFLSILEKTEFLTHYEKQMILKTYNNPTSINELSIFDNIELNDLYELFEKGNIESMTDKIDKIKAISAKLSAENNKYNGEQTSLSTPYKSIIRYLTTEITNYNQKLRNVIINAFLYEKLLNPNFWKEPGHKLGWSIQDIIDYYQKEINILTNSLPVTETDKPKYITRYRDTYIKCKQLMQDCNLYQLITNEDISNNQTDLKEYIIDNFIAEQILTICVYLYQLNQIKEEYSDEDFGSQYSEDLNEHLNLLNIRSSFLDYFYKIYKDALNKYKIIQGGLSGYNDSEQKEFIKNFINIADILYQSSFILINNPAISSSYISEEMQQNILIFYNEANTQYNSLDFNFQSSFTRNIIVFPAAGENTSTEQSTDLKFLNEEGTKYFTVSLKSTNIDDIKIERVERVRLLLSNINTLISLADLTTTKVASKTEATFFDNLEKMHSKINADTAENKYSHIIEMLVEGFNAGGLQSRVIDFNNFIQRFANEIFNGNFITATIWREKLIPEFCQKILASSNYDQYAFMQWSNYQDWRINSLITPKSFSNSIGKLQLNMDSIRDSIIELSQDKSIIDILSAGDIYIYALNNIRYLFCGTDDNSEAIGVFYWYLRYKYNTPILNNNIMIEEIKKLLNGDNTKINKGYLERQRSYQNKENLYKKYMEENEQIAQDFQTSIYAEYYGEPAKIADLKKSISDLWSRYIIRLSIGYTKDKEKGMY